MHTNIDIATMALLKIGERPIQSFNEDSVAAQCARSLFEPTVNALLTSHPWRFASRDFDLSRTDDGDFLLPAEVLRVLRCSASRYEIRGRRIIANATTIKITAIVKTETTEFPPFFISCLATRLAMEFCIPLTENQNAFNALSEIYEVELRSAKFIDSTTDSASGLREFNLINTRY